MEGTKQQGVGEGGGGQESSLRTLHPLTTEDRSGTVRIQCPKAGNYPEKGKQHKCECSAEGWKENGELTRRHLILSKAVVLKVVPDWQHLLRTC